MGLTGKFTPKNEVTVHVWEPPDANGDGPPVMAREEDGTPYEKTDGNGNVVKRYSPPEGFQNRPSDTGEENYVLCDERGQVVRDKNGNALSLPEGGAAVVNPDGTYETVPPNQLRSFLSRHTQV